MSAQSAVRSYQQSNVMTANPLKLVLMLYDRALLGCQQKNTELVWKALKALIDSLNMEAGPISGNLLAIYEYCGELAGKRKFKEIAVLLKDLRDTWASVGNKI